MLRRRHHRIDAAITRRAARCTRAAGPRRAHAGEYPPESFSDAKDGKINVNTATYAEMVESGRIDAATARLIVAFRSIAGPYASIYELREIDGISSETFASIEPYVTTGS